MHSCLIVEDLPDASQELRRRVGHAFPGCTVVEAATLAAARAALAAQRFDLILLDIGLPDGDGTELLTSGDVPASSTVVVTTIFSDDQHLFAALRAGAQGYLLKDDPESAFNASLQGIVAGRPPLSPAMARRMMESFRAHPAASPTMLTPREREVLALVARGNSVRHTSELLGLTQNTTAGYLKNIYQKLHVNSRAGATLVAVRLGLVQSSDR
ncbi:MAG: response regulator transcription factor [Pseudomonadales bacterium]|nr:response regulator transcription factor [Pseudomonadales bacterium]